MSAMKAETIFLYSLKCKNMKQNSNKRHQVKMMALLLLAGSTLYFTACKKNDNNTNVTPTPTATTTESVSEQDVADAVTEAVVMNKSGVADQTEEVVDYAKTSAIPCGGTKDTTITGTNAAGAVITYDYTYLCHTAVTCTLAIPTKFQATLTGHANYNSLKMTSNDSCSGDVTVTGLPPSASNYTVNFTFVRNGSQTSKVREKKAFTSVVTLTGTSIIVSKATTMITSGSANVVVTGAVTGGSTFTKTATLTFLGGRTATLAFSGGGSYPISW
jgi:hypothetical protein